MKKHTLILGVLFLISTVSYSQTDAESDTTKGQKKGEEVGNFVKSLVETALPVWGTISKVIWPDGKPNSKVKKKDADAAMDKQKETLKKELKDKLVNAAKEKITPIEELSDELSVVYRISQAAIFAQKDLADLTTELNKPDIDWGEARQLLSDAKEVLSKMDGVKDDEIREKVSEKSLQLTLINIKTDKNKSIRRLDTYLNNTNKNKTKALEKINELRKDFQAIDRLTAGYIFQIYNDLKSLSLWAKNAMDASETAKNPMFEELKEMLPKEN